MFDACKGRKRGRPLKRPFKKAEEGGSRRRIRQQPTRSARLRVDAYTGVRGGKGSFIVAGRRGGRDSRSGGKRQHTGNDSTDKGHGRTPLSWAAENGHEAVVRLLLEKEANVESTDKWYGRTPLSWAAEMRYEAVVKLLLEKGADVESRESDGRTPPSWATVDGHGAVVKLLLEKGADVESKDSDGLTPLSWAAVGGYEAVINLLREKEAYVKSTGSFGRLNSSGS